MSIGNSVSISRNFLRTIRKGSVYVLTATLAASVCQNVFGVGLPIFMDDQVDYLNSKKELDSFGNSNYEEQYGEYEDTKNCLRHYSRWVQDNNGGYSRTIKEYNFSNFTEETAKDIFDKFDNLELDDVFGKPFNVVQERKKMIDAEELQQPDYLNVTIYDENKNEFITYKESIFTNLCSTTLFGSLMMFSLPIIDGINHLIDVSVDTISKAKRKK